MKQRIVLLVFITFLPIAMFAVSAGQNSCFVLKGILQEGVAGESLEIDWWPMFQHDPAHTGSSSSIVPGENETLWVYHINRIYSVGFAPSVVDGRVFIGSASYFWCINSSTGVLLWSCQKPYLDPSTSPAVSTDRVVVSGGRNELYCFDVKIGNILWNFTAESSLRSSPIIDEGKVFVGSEGGELYCLNLTNGILIWDYRAVQTITASPTIAGNRLFVRSEGGMLHCIDAISGDQLWTFTLSGGGVSSSATFYEGKVIVGTSHGNNTLYCLESGSGELIWKYQTEGWISATPAAVDGKVFIGDRGNIARVYCFDVLDGSLIWKRIYEDEYGAEHSSPVVADGKIILCMGRKLYVLNETNGEIVWKYDPPIVGYDPSRSHGFRDQNLALAEGRIYLASEEGTLFCFGPMIYYSLTIDPQYLNNEGEPFTPLPTSCTFEFSNGTEKDASTPTTLRAPLGSFTINNATWNEYGVLPRKVEIYLDSDLLWRPLVNCTLPTTTSLILSSSTSQVGFKIDINGRLTCNEEGVSYAPILLSYSVTNGETWNEITQAYTSPDGEYSAIWMPTASGHYIVKAIWSGNTAFPKSSIQKYLAVLPVQEQNVLSVTSNSKVSNLIFNSTNNELHFNIAEPSEPAGYSDVFIPKDIVGNIEGAEVFLDGKKVDHVISSIEDSWLLHFTYIHGKHEVTISLGGMSAPFLETWLGKMLLFGIPIAAIIILTALYVLKKKQRNRALAEFSEVLEKQQDS